MTSERTLIDELLAEQQRLTAVERFAHHHEQDALPVGSGCYEALLPASPPGDGEQYAFSVDLDSCSGCKACVTACHNLNGLDDGEAWRNVGLLIGSRADAPFQQTITTACHHCVEPACLIGCPVLAYEKDPHTGIVRHLDDQCIGCQYCILKCPYDVPKYSSNRGIVRKCDMCSSRLALNEPPACAQACPNGAISITVVAKADIAEAARQGEFLPGAPEPGYTQPTTRYRSARGLPTDLVAADQHLLKQAKAHPPLVIMLVVTQLSVGAFCLDTLLRVIFPANLMIQLTNWHAGVALVTGLLALGASTLHLGRPLYAWRAIIGLRNSWLSREIIAFGLFATLALLHRAALWLKAVPPEASLGLATLVSAAGLLGVFCSLMIYRDARRPLWSGPFAIFKFFGTTALLGTAAILFVTTLQALLTPAISTLQMYHELTFWLTRTLVTVSIIKLGVECFELGALLRRPESARTARLLTGEFLELTTARFLLCFIGGILLPLAFLRQDPAAVYATLGVTFSIVLFCLLGEALERHLFFVAAVPVGMPGGISS